MTQTPVTSVPELETPEDEETQAAKKACEERIAQWKAKFREELQKRKVLKVKIENQLKRLTIQRQVIECTEKYDKFLKIQLEQKMKMEDPESQKKLKEIREDQARLQKMKDLWETYKEEYEKLPLARKRREAEVKCLKVLIELNLAKYRIAEAEKQEKLQQNINDKILQNNIIRIAELYLRNKKYEEAEAEQERKFAERQKYARELQLKREELEKKVAKQLEEEKAATLNRTEWMPLPPNLQAIMERIPKHKSRRMEHVDADTISINTVMLEEMVMQTDEPSAPAPVTNAPPITSNLDKSQIIDGGNLDSQAEGEFEEEEEEEEMGSSEPLPDAEDVPIRQFIHEEKTAFPTQIKNNIQPSHVEESKKGHFFGEQGDPEEVHAEYVEVMRSREEIVHNSPYVEKDKLFIRERNIVSNEVYREREIKNTPDFHKMSKPSTPRTSRLPRNHENQQIQSPVDIEYLEKLHNHPDLEQYPSTSQKSMQVKSCQPSQERGVPDGRYAKEKTLSRPQIKLIEEVSFNAQLLQQNDVDNASVMSRCRSIDNISAILDSEYSGAGDLISQPSIQGYPAGKYNNTFKNFSPPLSLGFLNETMDHNNYPKIDSGVTDETEFPDHSDAAPSGFLSQFKKSQNFF